MHSSTRVTTDIKKPFISSLPTLEQQDIMRKAFSMKSRFQTSFHTDMADIAAEPFVKLFRSEIIRLLNTKGVMVPNCALEELHQYLPQRLKQYNFVDGVNEISTYLYDTDGAFHDAYFTFIRECLNNVFPIPFYFQATPTIRIHCPNSLNSHHYPRYHTDINYGHPPEEINIWIPLTEPVAPQYHGFRMMDLKHSRSIMEDSNFDFSAFINKAVNDMDFNKALNKLSPQIKTAFGQFLVFDSRCIHTAEPMVSHTRVSIDIRILPAEDYKNSPVIYQGVGRRKVIYTPGHAYHHSLSSDL